MGSAVNQNEFRENPTVLLHRLHYWRMAFLGVVILLAGMLGGVAVTLVTLRHLDPGGPLPPLPAVKLMLARLGGALRLTPEQSRQIEPILEKHVVKLDQIQENGRKAIAEELRLLSQDMGSVLSEEQMDLWQQLFRDLPGSFGHLPQGRGPGMGRGPAPPGGWQGPPAGRRGRLNAPVEPQG